MHRERDFIDLSEDCEHSHRTFFKEFNLEFYPLAAAAGFSRDAALHYWMTCKVIGRLDDLIEKVERVF